MVMPRDAVANVDNTEAQQALALSHSQGDRPLCLCRRDGQQVELQIRKVNGHYFLARLPRDGLSHAPECRSFGVAESAPRLAPVVSRQDGTELVHIGFPMERRANQQPVISSPSNRLAASRTARESLDMESLLHHLWHASGLAGTATARTPWQEIKWPLIRAAEKIYLGSNLRMSERLFIPDRFDKEHIDQQLQLCERYLRKITGSDAKHVRFGLLLAPVASIKLSKHDYRVVFRHMPGFGFWFKREQGQQFCEQYAVGIDRVEQGDLAIALFTTETKSSGNIHLRDGALLVLPRAD